MEHFLPPIGMVLVTHERLGEAFIDSVTHILGERPIAFEAVCALEDPQHGTLRHRIREACTKVNHGRGVLLLVDALGSTPSNFCCELIDENQIGAMAGVNLPLILRALSHRHDLSLMALMAELENKPYQLIQKLTRSHSHVTTLSYPDAVHLQ